MANLISFSVFALLAILASANAADLVPSTTTLKYHNGPLLTEPIDVYVLWYGSFTPAHKAAVTTFISSLSSTTPTLHPSASNLWKTTQAYKDATGRPVSSTVRLAGELIDQTCSMGKTITRADILRLVGMVVTKGSFTYTPGAVYLVVTAFDIKVERLSMGSCGFHTTTTVSAGKTAMVAHVGDPALCSSLLALLGFLSSANATLVPSTITLKYDEGPLLTEPIDGYVLWYGSFTPAHKAAITTFISSLSSTTLTLHPSVSTWWKTSQAYEDAAGRTLSSTVRLAGELIDQTCSMGTTITRADILRLVGMVVTKGSFTYSPGAVYLVLTASDIEVERLFTEPYGFHTAATVSASKTEVVAQVVDPGTACLGLCSWPFTTPAYGPPRPPLVPPNGVGVDGSMVMNIATVIAMFVYKYIRFLHNNVFQKGRNV